MDVTQLRKLIDEAITQWVAGSSADVSPEPTAAVLDKPKRSDGKRAVRTKSTGDRVYLLFKDTDGINKKAWITTPDIREALGFSDSDVEHLEDSELISYQMAPSIYKVD